MIKPLSEGISLVSLIYSISSIFILSQTVTVKSKCSFYVVAIYHSSSPECLIIKVNS